MAQLDTLDLVVLVALLLGTIAYFTRGTYCGATKDPYAGAMANKTAQAVGGNRDIIKKMEEKDFHLILIHC